MDTLDELAEVAADLRAILEFERLCGATALPVEPVSAVDLGPVAPAPPQRRVAEPAPTRRSEGPVTDSRGSSSRRKTPPRERPIPKVDVSPAAAGPGRWERFAKGGQELKAEAPRSAGSLEEVRTAMGDCERCGLCAGRKQIVFGSGPERAPLMVIGEAPGFHEDQQGQPLSVRLDKC